MMDSVIKDLQIQVYRLDWQIGEAANYLKRDLESDGHQRTYGNIEWYENAVAKRKTILECIERLKTAL